MGHLTVTQEDARATYTGVNYVSTGSVTSGKANVTLSATIRDITAVPTIMDSAGNPVANPAYDQFAGAVSKAKVSFVIRNGATDTPITGCSNLPVGLVSSADPAVGTAVCTWGADIGQSPSATYTIGVVVNG